MSQVNDDVDPKKIHDLVVDYLVCCGYKEAAETLCADANIKNKDIIPHANTLEQRNNIRTAIVNGELQESVNQIEAVAPTLLKMNSTLHFKLLRQQLVELIREK